MSGHLLCSPNQLGRERTDKSHILVSALPFPGNVDADGVVSIFTGLRFARVVRVIEHHHLLLRMKQSIEIISVYWHISLKT